MNIFKTNALKIKRIHRLLNVKKQSKFVWNDLIIYHKKSGWKFGQFDLDKHIEVYFKVNEHQSIEFNYKVTDRKLEFSAIILNSFDEERINDILVLASHFNSLLNFGMVRVNIKYNYVEFKYSGELLPYMIFSGEIDSDVDIHYNITKDCVWAFNNLLETGEDPVFVFSELLKRNEENNIENELEE